MADPLIAPAVDRTIVSLSGASQSLVVANRQRMYLLIQNTGNANVGVNLVGGTAVIAGAGTFTLAAGGSMVFEGNFVPSNAINVIGTAAQSLACIEGTE